MSKFDLIALARKAAQAANLQPELLCALVEQESDWNVYAIRYEPAFRERYVAPLKLQPTEEIARSISWGLLQIMGETAREQGYLGDLPALCDPTINLPLGCKILNHELAVGKGSITYALLSYNGGSNQNYAEEVLARTSQYKTST